MGTDARRYLEFIDFSLGTRGVVRQNLQDSSAAFHRAESRENVLNEDISAAMSVQIPSLFLDRKYTHVYSVRERCRRARSFNPFCSLLYSETVLTATTHLNTPLL